MDRDKRYQMARHVTVIGAGINFFLALIKLLGGIVFHSHALIADAIHSFSDILTDIMVLLASKYGSQDADQSHPYGHKRIETAATFMLSLLLILAGIGIAYDSLHDVFHSRQQIPDIWALPIAFISILANEALFHYTRYIGTRIHSDLIIANAWHHRSDAAASIVVLIGILGTLIGFHFCDAIAASIVGCLIVQMGLSYGWRSLKELIDTSVDLEQLTHIEETIRTIDGVQKIHQLRTRMMGGDVFVDVHIQVSPNISVSEGHFIAQHVHQCLMQQFERIKDVTVHVDPEDDEICAPSFDLPNRTMIERAFLLQWRQDHSDIHYWVLHYLNGKLSIDLICAHPLQINETLKEQIQEALVAYPTIRCIRLLSQQATLAILPPIHH
jgi:cation diffusion facilitator family transporter